MLLAKVLLEDSNLLILDEPTKLDEPTNEIDFFLQCYTGTGEPQRKVFRQSYNKIHCDYKNNNKIYIIASRSCQSVPGSGKVGFACYSCLEPELPNCKTRTARGPRAGAANTCCAHCACTYIRPVAQHEDTSQRDSQQRALMRVLGLTAPCCGPLGFPTCKDAAASSTKFNVGKMTSSGSRTAPAAGVNLRARAGGNGPCAEESLWWRSGCFGESMDKTCKLRG